MVLPDRIELLWSDTSPLKDHGFFDPLSPDVYQLEDQMRSPYASATVTVLTIVNSISLMQMDGPLNLEDKRC